MTKPRAQSFEHGVYYEHAFKKKGKKMKYDKDYYMKKIAPAQKEYRSEAAKRGERISPTWMPDDIGTKNFYKSNSTAYLRKMN